MTGPDAAPEVRAAAAARSAARAARDWETADRLKAEIESAGWRVIDAGRRWTLVRAYPPDLATPEGIRYGSSATVPARSAEPTDAPVAIVVVAEFAGEAAGAVAALAERAPAGSALLVIADGPGAADDPALPAIAWSPGPIEVVRTATQLGLAGCLAIALRRAGGEVVVVASGNGLPRPGAVGTLVAALDDPTVAIVGATGIEMADLPRLRDADPGDVTAVRLDLAAFRRADALAALPVDERFRSRAHLAAWWSLRLRGLGADDGSARRSRRAVALPGLLLRGVSADVAPHDRVARRDGYRLLEATRDRPDLVAMRVEPVRA